MVAACATPVENGEEDFDAWYRKEHLYEISKCPGYRRTRRFMLVDIAQVGPGAQQKGLSAMPKYIALVRRLVHLVVKFGVHSDSIASDRNADLG